MVFPPPATHPTPPESRPLAPPEMSQLVAAPESRLLRRRLNPPRRRSLPPMDPALGSPHKDRSPCGSPVYNNQAWRVQHLKLLVGNVLILPQRSMLRTQAYMKGVDSHPPGGFVNFLKKNIQSPVQAVSNGSSSHPINVGDGTNGDDCIRTEKRLPWTKEDDLGTKPLTTLGMPQRRRDQLSQENV
ncbi:hypothetical protein ACP4OV_006377 [Aristida adscensionis]